MNPQTQSIPEILKYSKLLRVIYGLTILVAGYFYWAPLGIGLLQPLDILMGSPEYNWTLVFIGAILYIPLLIFILILGLCVIFIQNLKKIFKIILIMIGLFYLAAIGIFGFSFLLNILLNR